jgi:hypothetical protein
MTIDVRSLLEWLKDVVGRGGVRGGELVALAGEREHAAPTEQPTHLR